MFCKSYNTNSIFKKVLDIELVLFTSHLGIAFCMRSYHPYLTGNGIIHLQFHHILKAYHNPQKVYRDIDKLSDLLIFDKS